MKKIDQVNEPETDWSVTFEKVEEAQLRDMLKAAPAQRLVMAEELMSFVNTVNKAKQGAK